MNKFWSAVLTYLRNTDRWLLLFWLTASGVSVLFLSGIIHSGLSDPGILTVQLSAIGLGLCSAIVISLMDYRTILNLWKLYLPLCLILSLLPLFTSLGHVRGDNQAWLVFSIGSQRFSLQPSELLKISFITTLSLHLAKVRDTVNQPRQVLLLCFHGGAHVLLIQMQGDTGSALIFLFIFVAMLFCAGIWWRYIALAGGASLVAAPLLWFKVLSQDQKLRILTLFHPDSNEAYAWQQARSLAAIGYGGMEGTGVFAGKHVRVPEIHNDFIFSFVGESSGFIGCLGVIALLTVIVLKVLYNSSVAIDHEGRFLCIGVFAMMVAQIVINLGMCLSLLPVIGVTLPLLSYGGTSVLSMYLGLGLVLSVYSHSSTGMFSKKAPLE